MTPDRWARVKTVLADVLFAPPDQRAVVLERACAGDPSLADEVHALVEAEAGAGPLDAPVRLDAETQPIDLTASTVPLAGGLDAVGPYRLNRRIGKGGMGEVFVATDLRLKREVAIKVVHPRFASEPGFAQHLLREARAAAKLSHPNIATVFDVVEAGARLYLVMEYLRGETLAARLLRGPLPLRETLDVGRQMADALGHAHAHGLLHCDFKPANVMLTAGDRVKVLDFGLARTFQGPDSEALGASASLIRNRAGTPAYMAPEHRLGLPLGPPADVFALGLVLHEMCTGQLPAHLPGLRAPESATGEADTPLHPSVPRPLRAIVARALRAQPEARFRDGADVAAALSAVAGGLPAGPRAVLSGVGTLLLVAVTAGTMVAGRRGGEWAGPPGERGKPVLAVLPFSGPDDRPWAKYLAAGMTEFVTNDLAASPDLIVVSNGSVRAAKDASAPLPDLARELGATHLVHGELQPSDGALRVRVKVFVARDGRTTDAGLVETQARDIARANRALANTVRRRLQQAGLPTGPPPDRGQEWPSAAEVAEDYARGRDLLQHWSEGDNLDRAIEAFLRVTEAEPGFPSAHAYLGEAWWRKYRRTMNPQWASRAQAATFDALRLGANDARVRYTAGVVLAGTGRREQALQEARRAIDLQPTGDDAYRLMGRILSDGGDFAGAQPYFDAAITLRPGFAGNYHALGLAAYGHGHLETAIRAFSRAAELRPTSADAWQALGTAYHASGDLDRALQNYERANAIEPTDFAHSNIGLLHYWNGRYADAVRAYRKSAELSPNEPVTYRNLGDALRRTPERSQAPAAYRRAIELADVALSTNPRQPGLLTLKALCLARLGRARLALVLAEQGATEGAQDPEATYQAGVTAEVAGDRTRARAWLSRALELGYSKSLMDRDADLDDLRRAGWP